MKYPQNSTEKFTEQLMSQSPGKGIIDSFWPLPNQLPNQFPNHLDQNIEAITGLKSKSDRDIARHQRVIEKVAEFFGRPVFFFNLLALIVAWITFNSLPSSWNVVPFDPPPFMWLEKSMGLGSLMMTVVVLVRQNRQEQSAEQRKQLSLHLTLMTEQKVAKLISLIEELRKDLPNVKNRSDLEAEIMQQSVDPHQVINALEEIS